MKAIYAVFDTNVLVSSLLSKRSDSPTVILLDWVVDGDIVLLYNEEIVAEYEEVLHRPKFGFDEADIQTVLELVRSGLCLEARRIDPQFGRGLCSETEKQRRTNEGCRESFACQREKSGISSG
jgi:hypothetical protein